MVAGEQSPERTAVMVSTVSQPSLASLESHRGPLLTRCLNGSEESLVGFFDKSPIA